MDVSVVIRTKNEEGSIGKTLRLVEEQNFQGNYEVIVVDSGSTDDTLDIVRRHNVRIVEVDEEDFSYGRALNIGATCADGEFVVNLSAHAFPMDERWLSSLTSGFKDNNVAAVYGRQLSICDLNPFEALLNESFFGSEELRFLSKDSKGLRSLHFTNSNAGIRKDVWRTIRFNEDVIYGEDIVWQNEVLRAGFSIRYVPNAAVYHTHRVNIPNVYRNSVNCEYNMSVIRRRRKWIPLITGDLVLFCALLTYSMVRHVSYLVKRRCFTYLVVAPFWVLAGALGSAVGRISYRIKRELW